MQAVGGMESLVNTIGRTDPGAERMILTGLEEYNEELADGARSHMFVFENIVMPEDRDIRLVLWQVDRTQLALALEGTNEDLRSHIMKNLSERAR